jgi:hypothetical protein
LLDISTTIGTLADLRRTQPLISAETRALTDDALRSNIQAALARAARWTRHNLLAINVTPGRQLVRLAGFDAEPNRPLALHVWRTTGPSDADIDGAVARWAIAATASVSSRFTVTQHALQLASADIALLCASATAIIERASQVAIVNDTDATQAISALTAAGRQWRRTATWPDHLRLGGRSTELRNASADLRQALTETLRSGRDWRPARELFADSTPERHLAIACSSLQAASRVGLEVAASFQQLTHGQTRVWVDASHVPMPTYSVQKALDSLRYDWLPDPPTYHSAAQLYGQAAEAHRTLARATCTVADSLATPHRPPRELGDEAPWETVGPPPLDPLRAAQDRANLTPSWSAEARSRTISR